MTITYKQFKVTPCDHAPGKFDLYKVIQRKRMGDGTLKNPTGEEYDADVEVGFGMTLERCIESMIIISVDERLEDQTISLEKYLDEIKEEKNKFKEAFGQLFNIKIN